MAATEPAAEPAVQAIPLGMYADPEDNCVLVMPGGDWSGETWRIYGHEWKEDQLQEWECAARVTATGLVTAGRRGVVRHQGIVWDNAEVWRRLCLSPRQVMALRRPAPRYMSVVVFRVLFAVVSALYRTICRLYARLSARTVTGTAPRR